MAPPGGGAFSPCLLSDAWTRHFRIFNDLTVRFSFLYPNRAVRILDRFRQCWSKIDQIGQELWKFRVIAGQALLRPFRNIRKALQTC